MDKEKEKESNYKENFESKNTTENKTIKSSPTKHSKTTSRATYNNEDKNGLNENYEKCKKFNFYKFVFICNF